MSDPTKHPQFGTLLREFTTDAPTMRTTAQAICDSGCALDDVLAALAAAVPSKFSAHAGRHGTVRSLYKPDYGLYYARLAPTNHVLRVDAVEFEHFAHTSAGCWTSTTHVRLGGITFARTFDIPDRLFAQMLHTNMPNAKLRSELLRMEPGAFLGMTGTASLTAVLGKPFAVIGERFQPFTVTSITMTELNVVMLALF